MGSHRQAIEYDLLTKTGYTLADVGGALSNSALLSFATHLQGDSATAREIDPDAQWTLVPMLLARISDDLQQFVWLYSCVHAGKGRKPTQPKPIPRPGVDDGTRHIGKGAIPVSEFDEWYGGD